MIKMKETKCTICGGINFKLAGKAAALCHDECADCRHKQRQAGRDFVADLAEQEGEVQFAREVRAGAWDHRSDVQKAIQNGSFEPRKLTL